MGDFTHASRRGVEFDPAAAQLIPSDRGWDRSKNPLGRKTSWYMLNPGRDCIREPASGVDLRSRECALTERGKGTGHDE
jgi:hypothetical protein